MSRLHAENHLVSRIGWLRAAVLGANDGVVSTASLIMGVATASADTSKSWWQASRVWARARCRRTPSRPIWRGNGGNWNATRCRA